MDAALGRRRCTYEVRARIAAPRDTVWRIASSRKMSFDEGLPIEVEVRPRDDDPNVFEGEIKVGDHVVPVAYCQLEERPGEALLIQMLPAGGNTEPFEPYTVALLVQDAQATTLLRVVHDVTHTRFGTRVSAPIAGLQSARRIWQAAAMLLVLIFIHEDGHVLAMKSIGQPVQGMYFVPFFGGVAVAGAPHRTEGERGYVALMGPGFSILTTAVFFFAWLKSGEPLMMELAFMSAVLNGINLAPILPLD